MTYRAGAVFSLVDGPCSKDCKCGKMNQTLTATYSTRVIRRRRSPPYSPSGRQGEQNAGARRERDPGRSFSRWRCGAERLSARGITKPGPGKVSQPPSPPNLRRRRRRTAPVGEVVSRPRSRAQFPENRHERRRKKKKFSLFCDSDYFFFFLFV